MPSTEALLDRVRTWTLARQFLAGHPAASQLDVLHRLVGVYSSHPSAPLSIAARVESFDPEEFRRFDSDRLGRRFPAMRTSAHLVDAADAAMVLAATPGPASQRAWRLREAGVSAEGYEPVAAEICALCSLPRRAAEVAAALGRTSAAVAHLLGCLTSDGRIMPIAVGSLRSNQLAYVAITADASPVTIEPAAARRWLADRFLRAYGPARVEDLQWWAGKATARRMAEAAAELDVVDVGQGLLLPADQIQDFEQGVEIDVDCIDVLPVWDMYTMGYPSSGRSRIAAPEILDRLYDDVGNALGAVLLGGRPVAAWGSRMVGRSLHVTVDVFDAPARRPLVASMQRRFDEIAALLGSTEAVLDTSGERRPNPLGGKGNRARYSGEPT